MAYYITIDGGTTNTRLYLFDGERLVGTRKIAVGAANDRGALAVSVHDGLIGLCDENHIGSHALSAVVASGMIGSELGLYDAARIAVPACLSDLRSALVTVKLDDVCDVPITFIPGLKQDGAAMGKCDLIRGEETEAVGLLSLMKPKEDVALLLPGTHNKLMLLGKDGTIRSFFTAMSGDLIRAAAEHTVLSASLADGFEKALDIKQVIAGYDLCEQLGLTAALFKLRVGDKLFDKDARTLYAMLAGIVLHEDVTLIKRVYTGTDVYVSGSDPFRNALYALLCERTKFHATLVADRIASLSTPVGALKIALHG